MSLKYTRAKIWAAGFNQESCNFDILTCINNMFTETRKILIIEDVLKTTNESTLLEVENIFKAVKKQKPKKKNSAHDFVGLWSKKDASLIEKAIQQGCEQIHSDDWQ